MRTQRSVRRRGAGAITAVLSGVGLAAVGLSAAAPGAAVAATAPACTMRGTAGIPAGGGSRVDVLDSLAQIQPRRPRAGASGAVLCQGRGAFESFQIEVTAGAAGLSGVSMTAGALTGPAGSTIAAGNVGLYREDYAVIRTATDAELTGALPRTSAGACTGDCRFPDALIPDVDTLVGEKRAAFPFTVPAGENRAVWADVLVPAGQRPGTYAGWIAITSAAGALASVPVKLTVVNASIPATSTSHSAFFLTLGGGRVPSAAAYAQYAELGLENRISVVPNSALPGDPSAMLGRQLTGTDPEVRLRGAALTDFPMQVGWSSSEVSSYRSMFTRLGVAAKAWIYCDEVSPASCASDSSTAVGAWPGLPLLAIAAPLSGWPDPKTTVAPRVLASRLKGIVPLVQFIEPIAGYNPYSTLGSRMPALSAWRSGGAGRQVWSYTSCMSGGCDSPYTGSSVYNGWPSYGIDQVATEQRASGWQAFRYGIDGALYWGVNDDMSIWTDPYDSGMNGDGTLFYPYDAARVGGHTPVPVESIRLKRIRDGRQDLELLKVATSAGQGVEASNIAASVFPQMVSSAPSAANFDGARGQLMALFGPVT